MIYLLSYKLLKQHFLKKNLNKANLKKNKYNITQPIDRVQRKKHCRLSCEKWKVYEMC